MLVGLFFVLVGLFFKTIRSLLTAKQVGRGQDRPPFSPRVSLSVSVSVSVYIYIYIYICIACEHMRTETAAKQKGKHHSFRAVNYALARLCHGLDCPPCLGHAG